jgi:hypothetical protein
MTYKQVKNQVLKLLNQYTVAGNSVAESYNNQADYIKRIPSLINDAMMEISTTARKIEEVLELTPESAAEVTDQEYRFAMPSNFFQFKSGDNFIHFRDREYRHRVYVYRGQNYITLPKTLVEECSPLLIYYRYPNLLDETGAEIVPGTVLDNAPEVHRAIPYYVAGTLALHDDAFLASTLMNAYEDKLAKMEPQIVVEAAPVQDAYRFSQPHYDY